jgi:hypothetical protein
MAVKNWTHLSGTANWSDASSWSPTGVPQSGDVAIVTDGVAVADSTDPLSNLTILLGSTAGDPSPYGSLYWYFDPPAQGGAYTASPNPTLELNAGAVIGPATVIEAPQTPIASGGTIGATLVTVGSVDNQGTIGLPVDGSGAPGVLNFSITQSPFVNDGQINIAPQETSAWSGSTTVDRVNHPGDSLRNNGTINVYGTLTDNEVGILGNGTITLNSVSNGLGLAPTPGLLALNGGFFGGAIDLGESVIFNGGHLAIGADDNADSGTLFRFATNPANMIQIKDFAFSYATFSSGTLTVTGTDTGLNDTLNEKFYFGDLPATGGFTYAITPSETDVTWNPAGSTSPRHIQPPRPVLPHPVPTTPAGPPGYHLS